MAEPLLFAKRDGIATLTLNRPDVGNAINTALIEALAQASAQCERDASIRCVVLTGAGRLFCVGGDIGVMQTASDNGGAAIGQFARTLHVAVARLARMNKPLLCVVNGPAAGMGLSLAILGDVVLAAKSAHFTTAYGAIGLTPDGGMTWLLPRLIGLRRAQEMIVLNKRVSAEEGEAIGLVTRTVDDDELAAESSKIALQLAHAATGAIGGSRRLLLGSFANDLERQLECEAKSIATASGGLEGSEGMAAFLRGRRPDFTGTE